ncbi:MAG: hypothetical protein ACI8Y7_000647 [Candidatus Woesearchaeota archaeon]|jgi:uncharacterized protein (UPF0332 family)/predicted nucleotidyltransferase
MATNQLPVDAQKKMGDIQKTLEKFNEKLLAKFEGYISGVALLPPGYAIEDVAEPNLPDEEKTKLPKDHINTLVLIDDSDSQKLTKEELKEKLTTVIVKMAKEVDKHIYPQVLLYTELWQFCYDGKMEVLQLLAQAAPVFENGMLSAIKIAEVHKQMILKKFEKYIVSYVLAGSLVQGKANAESDIDVFIVIDDTDVKKMSRVELKDRLRGIIMNMGVQAGEMTGIKNKLNIQTYILTEFWDNIKEANPVIFTFLRDGVPFYDRGTFMPWKQLLRMGKVKPSAEAIDMYMSTGEQMLERTALKLNEIGMEDTYWSILYPSQAALMLFGLAPPTPRETPQLMRKVFVKKEKMLEESYVKILEANIKLRKELEHGSLKKVSGAQIDKCISDAQKFLIRVKKLFVDIEDKQQGIGMLHTYDHVVTIMRDILKLEGVKKANDQELRKLFKQLIIDKGNMPQAAIRMIDGVYKAKDDHDSGKLHKSEIEKVRNQSQELIRALVDYIQRKRGVELERMKIRVKHGEKFGEIILLDTIAFIIHDIDQEEKKFMKATITKDGRLTNVTDSDIDELEKALVKIEMPQRAFIKDKIFSDLKTIFGKDVEVLVNY